MNWLVDHIRALPWWAPFVIALSVRWVPKLILFPLWRRERVRRVVEALQVSSWLVLGGLYAIYVLAWTVPQLAEIVIFVFGLFVLGMMIPFIMMAFVAIRTLPHQPKLSRHPETDVPEDLSLIHLESATSVERNSFLDDDGWKPKGISYERNPKALDAVIGMKQPLSELRRSIEIPLQRPDLMEAQKLPMTAGILLYGPPGNGKTALVRAVAQALGLYFISAGASDLLDSLMGGSERNITRLFQEAKEHAPAIIFLDEIDAIGVKRGTSHMYHDSVLTQLLTELDGFHPRNQIFVIAATNRLESLDPALIREGRLGTKIYVPNPTQEDILEMLRRWTDTLDLADGIRFDEIAAYLSSLEVSGAFVRGLTDDLKKLWVERRFEENRSSITYADIMDLLRLRS